jgi:murein DD-endopeptidase MepM/ murein hydrolase activator NlpD
MADEPQVKPGEEIFECTLLGAVGKSGNAGIPHLHLETRIGPPGVMFEAMAYYSTQTSEVERLNYERWRTGGEFVHFDPMLLFEFLSSD